MNPLDRTDPQLPDAGQRQRQRLKQLATRLRVGVVAGSLITAGAFSALAARHTNALSTVNGTAMSQAQTGAPAGATATPAQSLFDGQSDVTLTPSSGAATSTPQPTTTPTPKATSTPRVKSSSSR